MKIFVINPGSTSTKLALYEDDKPVWVGGAHHPLEDLAPYTHIIEQMPYRKQFVRDMLAKAGIPTLETLVSKEGLGITNGTCAMTSVGALNLYDTICAAQLADLISSLTFTALTGQRNAYEERVHTVRGHKGQIQVARNLRLLTDNSEIVERSQGLRVQDAYALRCIPQVHGAVRDSLEYILSKVEIELNAVTDNPLLFNEDEAVISGGLEPGEIIVISGVHKIAEGEKVKILPKASATNAGGLL